MFHLLYENWSHDSDLQIVHADVKLEIDGEIIIEEPLCVDVGLPALLLSAQEDVKPSRWLDPVMWRQMPFVCCGCGDPECRAFSFIVRHKDENTIELIEVEERQQAEPRILASYTLDAGEYRKQVAAIGEQFLKFIESKDYRPYLSHTVQTVKELLARLRP